MTDEQIIAAAGEPVGEMRTFEREGHGMNVQYYVDADIDADLPEGTKLYTADAILSAAKPLRDRIAEIEAEVSLANSLFAKQLVESDQLRQQNAELTKQRDGLFDALYEATDVIVAYYGTDARLSKKCLAAIAANKTGGAA